LFSGGVEWHNGGECAVCIAGLKTTSFEFLNSPMLSLAFITNILVRIANVICATETESRENAEKYF